jgi:hypothetical protein
MDDDVAEGARLAGNVSPEHVDEPRRPTAYRAAPSTPRRFVCHACRAPNRAPYAGGTVRCAHCGEARELPPRETSARPRSSQEDAGRVAALARQSPAVAPVPALLASVVEGDAVLARGKEQELLELWFALRARALTDVEAAEALFVATRLLFSHPFLDDRPDLREALVDDAIDALGLARHRTVLGAIRVRQAAASGDVEGARAYFEALDRAPTDRQSDTHVRLAAATLAVAERRWADVLSELGARRDELPLDDEFADLAVVLRAHALERLGDADAAHRALEELRFPSLVRRARDRSPAFDLCRDTWRPYLERARVRQAEVLARRERRAAWGASAIAAGAAYLVYRASRGEVDVVAVAIGAVWMLLGGAVFASSLRRARRVRRTYLHGALVDARVVNARRVAFRAVAGGGAIFAFDVEIAGPHGPYRASFEMPSTDEVARRFVGRTVRVRVDPTCADFVVPEEDVAA